MFLQFPITSGAQFKITITSGTKKTSCSNNNPTHFFKNLSETTMELIFLMILILLMIMRYLLLKMISVPGRIYLPNLRSTALSEYSSFWFLISSIYLYIYFFDVVYVIILKK